MHFWQVSHLRGPSLVTIEVASGVPGRWLTRFVGGDVPLKCMRMYKGVGYHNPVVAGSIHIGGELVAEFI